MSKVNTQLRITATTTHEDGTPHSSLEIIATNPGVRIDALVALEESLLEAIGGHATRSLAIAKQHAEMKLDGGAVVAPKAGKK